MKQVFIINKCHILNDIAYCSKRIKEHIDANRLPAKDIIAMVIDTPEHKKAHVILKKQLGHTQTMFYGKGSAFYIYHDIHHVNSAAFVLMFDEDTTIETVRALMHKPDYEFEGKGIKLFTVRESCRCEYSGDL
jgi:hypothetical protein